MFLCLNFVILLLMLPVLKAHKSLCYYVIFIHVPAINKALNLNLSQLLLLTRKLLNLGLLVVKLKSSLRNVLRSSS